jgi:hypothetical protein
MTFAKAKAPTDRNAALSLGPNVKGGTNVTYGTFGRTTSFHIITGMICSGRAGG